VFLLIAITSISLTCAHSDDGTIGLEGLVSWAHFKTCGAYRVLLQTVLQLQLPPAPDPSAPLRPSFLPMLFTLPPLPLIPMLSTLPTIPVIPTPPVVSLRTRFLGFLIFSHFQTSCCIRGGHRRRLGRRLLNIRQARDV